MKKLNNLLETFKAVAKHEQGKRKPGVMEPPKTFVDNTPVSLKGNVVATTSGTQEFIDDHEIEMLPDRNGNKDDVFKATNIKHTIKKEPKHGYTAKKSEDVNEMSATQMKKREEVVKSMKSNFADFKKRYGKDAKSVMYATATKQAMKEDADIEEALDYNQKAKENVEFHHGQAMDYAKEIQAMLGEYKKHAAKESHIGDYHAGDMANIHGHLRQAHDALKYAVMGVKPVKPLAVSESTEHAQQEGQYESILEAVQAHQTQQEEEQLVSAYSEILESIYDSLSTEEEKEQFIAMLESDDAFDQLEKLVEETIQEAAGE